MRAWIIALGLAGAAGCSATTSGGASDAASDVVDLSDAPAGACVTSSGALGCSNSTAGVRCIAVGERYTSGCLSCMCTMAGMAACTTDPSCFRD